MRDRIRKSGQLRFQTIETLVEQHAVGAARGFKRDVKIAKDLPELTDRLLARAALDALSMAAKAGLVAAGFGKTETALERNEPLVTGDPEFRPLSAGEGLLLDWIGT